MPENKVRVTRLFGTGAIGLVDPMAHMFVKHHNEFRWIKALDSGNFQVSLAMTSGGDVIGKAYPHDLFIDAPTASGYNWPSGSGSVTFGHSGFVSETVDSGVAYMGGDGIVHVFGR